MAIVKDLDATNYDDTVKSGVVLVDFWAPWCSPCKMLGTLLEQIAPTAPAEVVIGKVNVEDHKDLAARFGVSNVPRLMLYKDGAVVKELTGMQSKSKLLALLSEA